ncbi:MAG TPA: hypothetical protein VF647_02000 [Longimicrobium sp.]
MSRNRDRDRKPQRSSAPSALEEARNELFSHIHRCGVLRAEAEQQEEWMKDTVDFMGERYPALTREELDELAGIGLRFCRPVIANSPVEVEAEAEAVSFEAEAEAETETETAAA